MINVKDTSAKVTKPDNKLLTFLKSLWPLSGATQNIDAVDGLRAVAVLLTMLDHILLAMEADPRTQKSTLDFLINSSNFWFFTAAGVELFFVLSGFLLFIPYARTVNGLQKFPSTRKFYFRRLLRITPAYWTSLLIIVIFFYLLNISQVNLVDLLLHIFLVHNWSQNTSLSINSPYWTMAVECQFYLILPGICWLMLRLKQKKYLVLGISACLSPIYGILLSLARHHLPTFFVEHITILNLTSYLCVFISGIVCSFIYIKVKDNSVTLSKSKQNLFFRLASIIGLIVLLCYIVTIGVNLFGLGTILLKLSGLINEPILGISFGCILLGVLFGWDSWKKFFSNSILRFIGIISYSLYIWNRPFYSWIIEPIAGNFSSGWAALFIYVILTITLLVPFAFLFYTFIEKPFIKMRRKQY